MKNPKEKAELFRALHVPGRPLVLFNIWDPGSAKAVVSSGASAIATGSWSVANANGFSDGERVPLDLAIDNLSRIVRAVEAPVSVDLESGYGREAADVGHAITRSIQAGAIGCNLEDSFPENGTLRDIAHQVERIKHARGAADAENHRYFINARTDVFFQSLEQGESAALEGVLKRARAYADAGADGLFVPGLTDEKLIAQLVEASPLPLNIMTSDKTPTLKSLAELGVSRVSHGPGPYLEAMKFLENAARRASLID